MHVCMCSIVYCSLPPPLRTLAHAHVHSLPVVCVQGCRASRGISQRRANTEKVQVYSSSWWRCTPKVMPFTPEVALAPEEWEALLGAVCSTFHITAADVELVFRLLCRAKDFPDVVVRLRGTFFPMFDKMPARVLRLLVMHARM